MDETALNFAFADPANGGDPKTLNVASLTDYGCIDTCTFQRGFRSVASETVTYEASVTGVPGTVMPASFTVNPGQFVILNVEVDGAALPAGANSFGELVITPQAPAQTFSINPDTTAIPDGGYDGTLASMACETVTTAGVTNLEDLEVELALDHTFIGDLVVKLVNPDGLELGLLSRPAADEMVDDGNTDNGFGDSNNLLATSPLTYSDNAVLPAENMGDFSADTNEVVCQDGGSCEFSPAPDSVAQPPGTLAEMITGTNDGDWMLCVGDSAGFDTGEIDTVTLNFIGEPPAAADLHLPMVIVGFPPEPEIDVTPVSLSQSQLTDETNDQVLNIANLPSAGADLNWTLGTDFSVTFAEQVDATGTLTNGIVSGFFLQDNGGAGSGAYSADDFVLANDASIESMFFEGFANGATLDTSATAIQLKVYADVAGLPAGHPEDGNNLELFSLDIPIADPSLDLTDNNILIDIVAANGGSSLDLMAGTYWVTVYPTQDSLSNAATRWAWFVAGPDVAGAPAQLVSPVSFSIANWTALPGLIGPPDGPNFEQLRYNIAGSSACGAPWLSTSSAGSTVGINDSIDVTVTFDSTGLAPGTYNATLCIDSNDTDEPQVLVPVTLTVDPPAP